LDLIQREECGLRVFENKVLRRIFAPKRDEESCIIRSYIIYTLHQVLLE
jgi:hypothetical protein